MDNTNKDEQTEECLHDWEVVGQGRLHWGGVMLKCKKCNKLAHEHS